MDQQNNTRGPVIGCDIGNAYAYASVARGRTADPLPLMPAEIDKAGMPTEARISVDGEVNVYPVDRSTAARKGGTVAAVKRMLDLVSIPLPCSKQPVSPFKVYSTIARDLVRTANETAVNKGLPATYNVVFTYPAAFYSPEYLDLLNAMQASIESMEVGGNRLKVLGRLPEPAAAAIQYLNYIQHVAPKSIRFRGDELNVLVYDLGHGTFDLALVTARSDVTYDLHKAVGDDTVGGLDFDEAIYEELCAQLYRTYHYKPAAEWAKRELMRIAREAKLELCTDGVEEYPVRFTVFLNDEEQTLETTITRARFEEISSPLLQRTLAMTAEMLAFADQEHIRVDRIILTGGASQMPMVRRSLQELVGDRFTIEEPYQPSRAISFGAALFGAFLPGKNEPVDQTTSTSPGTSPGDGILRQKTLSYYGLMAHSGRGDIGYRMYVLISPGEKLPASSGTPLFIEAPDTGVLELQLTCSKDGKEHGTIWHYRMEGMPTQGCMEISISVDVDLNMTVSCKAEDGTIYRAGTGGGR